MLQWWCQGLPLTNKCVTSEPYITGFLGSVMQYSCELADQHFCPKRFPKDLTIDFISGFYTISGLVGPYSPRYEGGHLKLPAVRRPTD